VLAAVAGCGGGGDKTTAPEWSFGAQMPHRRSYPASAEIGGKIYVATGMVGETGKPLDVFDRFDPGRNEWSALPAAPKAFSAAAGANLDGRFWVIGGNSPEASGKQVYSYDLQQARWRPEAPLPARRTNLAAVTFREKLYAIGGLDPLYPTRTVFVYDPAQRRWTKGTPLPVALQAHSAVVFRDEIWVIGGRVRSLARQRRVWIYNPRTDRWRAGPPLPKPMDTLATSATDDEIHAIVDEINVIYDGKAGRWRQAPRLQMPRHALAVYTIGNTLYAVGGCLYPQLRDSTVVEKISVRNG
jgi:N-acetylneuraminic acid mutarotase